MIIVLLAIIAGCLLFGASAIRSGIATFLGTVAIVIGLVLAIYPLMMGLLWLTGDKVTAMAIFLGALTMVCVFYFGRPAPRSKPAGTTRSAAPAQERWSPEEQVRLAQGATLADLKARSKRS